MTIEIKSLYVKIVQNKKSILSNFKEVWLMPNYITSYELTKQAKEQVMKIIMKMNGFSEEEFLKRYANDACFHNGFEILVDLFIQAKFDI
jgi:hypothetical protein